MTLRCIVLPLMGFLAAGSLTAQSLSVTPTASVAAHANHPPAVSAAKLSANPPQFGDPLPGLPSNQAMAFTVGQAQFQVTDGPADGLGPIFNAQSCNACHTQPLVNS